MGKTIRRLRMLGALAAATALTLAAAPTAVAAGPAPGATFTCEASDIPSGTYGSLTVAGPCGVEDGASIVVTGSVTVMSGAMLNVEDAASFTVGKNVTAMEHSLLLLGDDLSSAIVSVAGNVAATDAFSLLINNASIGGNVTLRGGGNDLTGGAALPWAVAHSTISGNLTVSGQSTTYLAVVDNAVHGNVTLSDITVLNEGGFVTVAGNVVARNLSCTGIAPAVSSDDPGTSAPDPNTVGRNAIGQCAGLTS